MVSDPNEIAIIHERMNIIDEINVNTKTVTVYAGVFFAATEGNTCRKRPAIPAWFGMMKKLKKALAPMGILNPDKFLPD